MHGRMNHAKSIIALTNFISAYASETCNDWGKKSYGRIIFLLLKHGIYQPLGPV